jgi:zinc transport system permease protein
MDDFFVRALMGGTGVALAAGPVGCFIVWRRMVYFGAALAHSALLGVALGFLLGIDPVLGILALCLCLAVLLVALERRQLLPVDTLLGVLAHLSLAAGLVIISLMEQLRIDLMGYLFGDVLAVSAADVALIYAMLVVVLASLAALWRSLLAITVDEDIAAVEGVKVLGVRLAFVLLVAAVVAIGMKIVGMLLILSLLIIPAAAARRLSRSPEEMAVAAAMLSVAAVLLGLFGSLHWDLPSGPLIVLMAALFFVVSLLVPRGWRQSP